MVLHIECVSVCDTIGGIDVSHFIDERATLLFSFDFLFLFPCLSLSLPHERRCQRKLDGRAKIHRNSSRVFFSFSVSLLFNEVINNNVLV